MSTDNSNKELSSQVRPVPAYAQVSEFGSGEEFLAGVEEKPFHGYLRVLLKYRWLILSITTLVVVVSTLYSLLATPLYTASATLKIGTYAPLLPGAGVEDSLRQQTREMGYLNTQITLLTSLSLADSVYSEEGLAESLETYFSRRTGLFSVFTPFWKKLIGTEENQQGDKSVDNSYTHPVKYLRSYIKLISVTPIRKTSLVSVSATTADAELSAQIANAHTQGFIDLVRQGRQKTTLENLVFLKSQSRELSEKVALAERELSTYAEENAIVSVNKDENIVVRRMSELNQLLTEATGKRIQSETLFQEAESGSGLNSSTFDDSSIQRLRTTLEEAQSEYDSLSQKFKSSYPRMVQLKARIDSLKENLTKQRSQAIKGLEARFNADKNSEEELKEQLEIQKSKAFELSRRQVQYNIMKREYDSLRDLHQAVLRQLKEAQMSSESSGTNISVTDRAAIPLRPSSPRRLLNILVSMLIGPCLGIGVAFLLESLDNTLKTPDDVRQSLQLPALGVVPIFSSEQPSLPNNSLRPALVEDTGDNRTNPGDGSAVEDQPNNTSEDSFLDNTEPDNTPAVNYPEHKALITVDAPRSVTSEAFRTVRTSILLSSADNPPKIIMVTSGKKAEGKTTLVSNLCVTLAQSSSSTIIVDADLRRPTVHRNFDIDPTSPGLVDYLTGQKELEEVIHQSKVGNLWVIPSGPTPPNPAELVGSNKMANLLQELAKKFDYVFVDTPPVLPVTDAVMLSRSVDGVVLVVRGQHTHKRLAKDAANRLRQVGANVLGVVLNDVDLKSGDYYYYYKDTYAYYYGEDDDSRNRRRRMFG